jgi:hypothetical protein
MPTVIQTVSSGLLGGVANKTVTLTATQPGNSLIVSIAVEGGATAYTGFTIADNAGGGSNTYSQAGITTASALFRSCCVKYCLAPTSGVTSVTVTGTGGSGGMYGVFSVQEVSGISALDRYTAGATGASSPYTMTASAVDTAATDFVVSCISVGNGSATVGISNPPTGYTTAAISQNDSTDAGGAIAYRINSTTVTDTCQWAATSWVATAPVNIVSFVGSGGVTDTTITPSAGTSALAGVTPTVTRSGTGGSTITPNTGALSAAGQAPIRSVGVSIAPAVAALALAGIVSVQTLTVVPPVAGALTLAGQAPTVSVAAGVVRTPTVGSIGLTATAPIIIRSQAIAPAVGVISAGGQAPSLLLASICIPNSGALSLTGSTPVSPGTIVPTATSMTLTGNAPVLLRAFTVAPNAAALGFVGFAPQAGNAVSISPTAGSLSLNGVAAVLTRAGSPTPKEASVYRERMHIPRLSPERSG